MTTSHETRLVEELQDFFNSTKTSEFLSSELRGAITVPTGLEAAARGALAEGFDVVIAGSAGGGKTHLLRELERVGDLPPFIAWPKEPEPDTEFIRIVPDATALLTVDERLKSFANRPSQCRAVAIAINEGPLLALAHDVPEAAFSRAVAFLHAAQRGVQREPDPDAPTVLDVGGFDPVSAYVVSNILALPVLQECVFAVPCSCEDPGVCPRKVAWQMLADNEQVRDRVNDLLDLVNTQGQPILFRDLWGFVADIATGGNCDSSSATSAWFWRVFFGDSEISQRLRAIANPDLVVFPRIEAHLYYGDWDAAVLLDGLESIPPLTDPPFGGMDYTWLKCQLLFFSKDESIHAVVRDEVDLELRTALEQGNTNGIVKSLNEYMTYGFVHAPQTSLFLWSDMGVEKRVERPRGAVSLATADSTHLEVRRSLVVANHPNPVGLFGPRVFLTHPKSGASLELSSETLRLLRGGKSYRTSDRPHTDMEWHISKFYSDISASTEELRLVVAEFDFDVMEGRLHSFRVSGDFQRIEPEAS